MNLDVNSADSAASNPMDEDAAEAALVAAWVVRAQAGDEEAFGELVKHYHTRFLRWWCAWCATLKMPARLRRRRG
jgi:hypothetical protein